MAPCFFSLPLHAFTVFFTLTLAAAHDDTMDTSSDSTTTTTSMSSNLHFRPLGDTLWFLGWVPQSTSAMVGACVGLFALGVVERWVAAVRRVAETAWRARAQTMMASRTRRALNKGDDEKQKRTQMSGRAREVLGLRSIPPFIPNHDIARGVLHAVQAALGYALMLAVMTYQAAFIISIVVGLGVGETLFGRSTAAGTGTGIH